MRPQLAQRLVVLPQVVQEDAHDLADARNPAAASGSGLRVLVRGGRIGGQQLAGSNQVPGDAVRGLLREWPQLSADLLRQLLARDALRDRGALRQARTIVVPLRAAPGTLPACAAVIAAGAAAVVPTRAAPIITTGTAVITVLTTVTAAVLTARATTIIALRTAPIITTGTAVITVEAASAIPALSTVPALASVVGALPGAVAIEPAALPAGAPVVTVEPATAVASRAAAIAARILAPVSAT